MKLLNTEEAAERLGVITERVRQLIKAGRLPAEKVGRDYVIKENDLEMMKRLPPGRPPGKKRKRAA